VHSTYARRYNFDDGYNTYSTISVGDYTDYFGRVDCNEDGNWFIMGMLPYISGSSAYWRVRHYDVNDNLVAVSNGYAHPFPGSIGYYTYSMDAVAMMNATGTHAKDHVAIEAPVYGSPQTFYVMASGREDTAYTASWYSVISYTGFYPGCSYLSSTGYLRSAEADPSGPYIWFLKNGPLGDLLCNKWDTSGTTLSYTGDCIGTGYPGSTDNTWRDSRDVTMGEQDTLYILDYDNGTTRIKGFSTSSMSSVGSVTVNGLTYEPQRLDGTKSLGFLVMLEGFPIHTQYNYGKLYVFTDTETPPG
jgi:hypothetical protein